MRSIDKRATTDIYIIKFFFFQNGYLPWVFSWSVVGGFWGTIGWFWGVIGRFWCGVGWGTIGLLEGYSRNRAAMGYYLHGLNVLNVTVGYLLPTSMSFATASFKCFILATVR